MALHGHMSHHQAANARNRRIAGSLVAFVCICLAFVGGFLVRGDLALLDRVGLTAYLTDEDQASVTASTASTYDSLSPRIAEVEAILNSESLDEYDLDDATSKTLTAFAESTADPFLRYYDPVRYAAYVQQSAGKYAGIGALFSENEGKAYVVDIFEGSAAQAAGVEEGDFVVAIDGDRSQAWSTTEVVNALSRDEGETVVVTWRRPSAPGSEGGEEFTTTLSCSVYEEPNIVTELHDGVGYIAVKQLTYNSGSLVADAVKGLDAQGALTFVLDVRSNPGGYLTQAVDIASLFVKSGVIVEVDTRDGKSTKTATGQSITEKPLVVLVNGDTSAAAEVLAAALQDSQRATLVGTTTMGKGSVQVVKELSFGGAIRFTAAFYKTPLGHDINSTGIAPNITVNQSADSADDAQKAFAIDTAKSFVTE